jgi:hypothetical protein
MGIITYIGSIVASTRKSKNKKDSKKRMEVEHPIQTYTKEQSLKWAEEGKCYCCGDATGEYEGICDHCRNL